MNPLHTPSVTWRTHLSLALLALVYIFSVIDRQVIAILIQPIKTEFGATDTQMGLLSGLAFGLFYAALGVPVGKLADRYNRSLIVAVCCSLWSVATLACGLATQFWQLFLARMSVAIGEAGGMAAHGGGGAFSDLAVALELFHALASAPKVPRQSYVFILLDPEAYLGDKAASPRLAVTPLKEWPSSSSASASLSPSC